MPAPPNLVDLPATEENLQGRSLSFQIDRVRVIIDTHGPGAAPMVSRATALAAATMELWTASTANWTGNSRGNVTALALAVFHSLGRGVSGSAADDVDGAVASKTASERSCVQGERVERGRASLFGNVLVVVEEEQLRNSQLTGSFHPLLNISRQPKTLLTLEKPAAQDQSLRRGCKEDDRD